MGENQDLYEKIERHISSLYENAAKDVLMKHSQRTIFWLLKLNPDADVALKIAAFTHDIERLASSPPLEHMIAASSEGWQDPEFLRRHSTKGAEIIGEILKGMAVEPGVIDQVQFLVAGHEFPGTDDQNILKDADSISFFENNVMGFLRMHVKTYGKEKVRAKFEWMYSRISSEPARQIVEPWYHQAMAQLDSEKSLAE